MIASTVEVPDGFRPLAVTPERAAGYNPIAFQARRIDGALALGFRVGPEHLNPGGRCHGGVLASFCDVLLAFAILHDTATLSTTILPTINLNLDYLAGALPGAWVQGTGITVSVTRNLAVAQGLVTAGGVPVVRASGTYKVGGARVTVLDTGAWLRARLDQA